MLAKFGKYVLSSLTISLLYWALLYLFTDIIKLWYMLSAVITAIILTATGFCLNYFWTWSKQKSKSMSINSLRFVRYAIVGGGTTLLGWSLLYVFTEYAGLWYMLSSVIGTVIVIVVAFALNNYWTWGKSDKEPTWLSKGVRICRAYLNKS